MAEQHRVPTRVGSLAVRVVGEGPPAVLWHSPFVDERSWQRIEQGLARERRLVLITGPGRGSSDDPNHRYSLDDCTAAAVEVLSALGIDEPVDWAGNAWDGHVGVVFAATWPDRCRSLVTFGTPIQSHGRSACVQLRALLAAYRVVGMVDFLSGGISDVLSPTTRSTDPDAVALVVECLRTMRRRALASAMVSISLGRPDLMPRLAAVRCPTVFVTGTHHPEWSPREAQEKSHALPNGSAAVIPIPRSSARSRPPRRRSSSSGTSGRRQAPAHEWVDRDRGPALKRRPWRPILRRHGRCRGEPALV